MSKLPSELIELTYTYICRQIHYDGTIRIINEYHNKWKYKDGVGLVSDKYRHVVNARDPNTNWYPGIDQIYNFKTKAFGGLIRLV